MALVRRRGRRTDESVLHPGRRRGDRRRRARTRSGSSTASSRPTAATPGSRAASAGALHRAPAGAGARGIGHHVGAARTVARAAGSSCVLAPDYCDMKFPCSYRARTPYCVRCGRGDPPRSPRPRFTIQQSSRSLWSAAACASRACGVRSSPPVAGLPAAAPPPVDPERGGRRRRRPRALPVRVRPPLQGLPRARAGQGRRAGQPAPLRRPGQRGRVGGAARDRARRDRAADPARPGRTPTARCCSRRCCRWAAPPWSAPTSRSSSASRSRRTPATSAATRRTRSSRRSSLRPARRSPPPGCPGAGPSLQDLLTDDPLRGHRPGRVQLLGRGRLGARARGPGLARAGQLGGHPDGRRSPGAEAAYWCRMPERNHLRWVLPYDEDVLLDAMSRLHAGAAACPSARAPSTSGRSGPTACWCRCGTCRRRWRRHELEAPVAELQVRLDAALADEAAADGRPAPFPRRAARPPAHYPLGHFGGDITPAMTTPRSAPRFRRSG